MWINNFTLWKYRSESQLYILTENEHREGGTQQVNRIKSQNYFNSNQQDEMQPFV